MPNTGVEPAPFRLGRQPALDGVRAVAVLLVMCGHEGLSWLFPAGGIGVDIFFVLSGFLITSLLLEERRSRGRIDLRHFYARRARRLLPALLLLCGALAGWAAIAREGQARTDVFHDMAATLLYSSDYVRALDVSNLGLFGHTWSLAVEEQFYVVWPALLIGLLVAGARGAPLALLLTTGAVLASDWRLFVWRHTHDFPHTYNAFDTRADGLLLGAALAVAMHHGLLPRGGPWPRRWRRLGAAGFVVLLVLAARPGLWSPGPTTTAVIVDRFASHATLVGFAATALVAGLVLGGDGRLARALGSRPAVALGRISYALYLYDWPIKVLVSPDVLGTDDRYVLLVVHVGLTLVAATLSWWLVERWVLNGRRSAARPNATRAATATAS